MRLRNFEVGGWGGICPVKAVSRHITSKQWPSDSEEKAFGPWVRTRLCALLRLDGEAVGVQASRAGSHALRAGGATAMWQTGYEVEIIKGRGRWESASFRGYLRGDYRILSTIWRNMMAMRGNAYRFPAHGERVNLIDQTNDGRAWGRDPGEENQENIS